MRTGIEQKFDLMHISSSSWKKALFSVTIVILSLGACFSIIPYKSNIELKQIFVQKSSSGITIGGFYHFSTVNNPWRYIVNEQMLFAFASGLVDASLNIYVTGLGKIELNKTIYDIFRNPKFIYEYNNKTEAYEYPTLKKLEKFCLNHNESLVWYAHSKGASHATDNVPLWRGVMNHFVLDRWRLCYDLLSTTNYTTCGAILTFDSVRKPGWNTYYAGNMWWAKCSHVNRLTRIEKIDQSDRWIAELYVTSEPDVGHFNCFSSNPHPPVGFDKHTASCTVNQPMWTVR